MNCFDAGRRALVEACMAVFGTVGEMRRVNFQGKTDTLILSESLASMGFDREAITRGTERLKGHYFAALRRSLDEGSPRLLPGVVALLDRLAADPSVFLGLLTGNFRESAHIKLERFGLAAYFSFGAYGDDAEHRNDLPPVARELIARRFGLALPYRDMVIIGDTEHDINCARAHGAVALAVGTGWASREVLAAGDPDHYFDDLSDTTAVLRAIYGS